MNKRIGEIEGCSPKMRSSGRVMLVKGPIHFEVRYEIWDSSAHSNLLSIIEIPSILSEIFSGQANYYKN